MGADPTKRALSASMAWRALRLSPTRRSPASLSSSSAPGVPERIAFTAASECSLIASCAVSRPAPCLTASMRMVVVARKGRLRAFSLAIAEGNASIWPRTVSSVSREPSIAKNASGSATRLTTEHDTSPSFHWPPARDAVIAT